MYMHMYTYMYMYVYVYVCIYIYMYMYTYACDLNGEGLQLQQGATKHAFSDNLDHYLLEFVISPKYSGTQIIVRDSHSNRLTSEDTEYNNSVY